MCGSRQGRAQCTCAVAEFYLRNARNRIGEMREEERGELYFSAPELEKGVIVAAQALFSTVDGPEVNLLDASLLPCH